MARILIVDDDLGTVETFAVILRCHGYSSRTAMTAQEGLEHALTPGIDMILADYRLPDFSGLELLRQLRECRIATPVVIMTAFGTISSAVEATRLGAVDYVEKPLFEDDILRAVESGLAATEINGAGIETPVAHAAARWAELVMSAVFARTDPHTVEEWGIIRGTARATIEKRCQAAGLAPKSSLDFARMLRAIVQGRRIGCRPEALMDADPRTLTRLFDLAGLTVDTSNGPSIPTPARFLEQQRFVTDPLPLAEIARALARRDLL